MPGLHDVQFRLNQRLTGSVYRRYIEAEVLLSVLVLVAIFALRRPRLTLA